MVDLIQIYDGAFYCPARKWENKKHSQTNWRHHIIPFKSPNVFYFSVSAFLKLFYSALSLSYSRSLSSRCLGNPKRAITISPRPMKRQNKWPQLNAFDVKAFYAGEFLIWFLLGNIFHVWICSDSSSMQSCCKAAIFPNVNTKMAHILQLLHDFMVSPILILNTNQIFTFDSFNAHTKKTNP